MRCNTCCEYINCRTKFNARKQDAQETYLSVKIFRFYSRCTRCRAEITFKTDPKSTYYVAERGATRNFELWMEGRPEDMEEEREAGLAGIEEKETNGFKAGNGDHGRFGSTESHWSCC